MSQRKSIRPADQVLHRRPGAAIRHVLGIGAHRLVEHDAAEMRGRADAGRAVVQLARIGLGIGDELLERVGRKFLAHDHDQRNFGDQRHRREIVQRIVQRLVAIELRIGVGGDGAEQRRVAVRRGLGDALAAQRPAAAADIFHHHALAEDRAHALGHDPGEHVDRAAGRGRHHHADRAARIVLRQRRIGSASSAAAKISHRFIVVAPHFSTILIRSC